jgi:plasmid stabilization system protein ParE
MTRLVVMTDRAHSQMEAIFQWWAEHRSVDQAANWYNTLATIESLAENPERCAASRENGRFALKSVTSTLGLVGAELIERFLPSVTISCWCWPSVIWGSKTFCQTTWYEPRRSTCQAARRVSPYDRRTAAGDRAGASRVGVRRCGEGIRKQHSLEEVERMLRVRIELGQA